jgi:hypothetical protein
VNTRRTALIGLNVAGAIGVLLSIANPLPDARNRGALVTKPATGAMITGTISKRVYEPAARALFDPVAESAPKAVESARPPFRLVGIVSQSNDSFAVVQIDERMSVELRLHEQIKGWRLEDIYRTSARFVSKEKSVEIDLNGDD